MHSSQALIPALLEKKKSNAFSEIFTVFAGSIFVALLAQLSFPLPFTPVPVTGQTFGVALLSLLWGRKRAGLAFLLYLSEGAIGLPVFALGRSGLHLTPTVGYLVGMLLATQVVGALSDKGFASTIFKTFLCCLLGSLCIFTFGLLGLLFFVPSEVVLKAGLFPFLIGDVCKNLSATIILESINKFYRKKI